jgi:hypothetical protein
MIQELLKPMHPNARPMNGLLSRVASALARPWQVSYVAPRLRTLDAVAYAIRGYDVYWTPVTFDEDPDDPGRNPSSVCYRIFKATPATHGERVPSHGVELSTLFPGWAHKIECDARNAFGRARWRAHQIRSVLLPTDRQVKP